LKNAAISCKFFFFSIFKTESQVPQIATTGAEGDKSKPDEKSQQATAPTTAGVGDVEKNPVFDSIARYLGIDLSAEGKAARNRRGIAIIVHGPPASGKSRAAIALAKHYECALLNIDSIIIEAIANSSSAAAAKARELCAEQAIEQNRLNALNPLVNNAAANAQTSGLSVEAVTQHSINRKLFSSIS
jgi:hydrocephalus-inducing protein